MHSTSEPGLARGLGLREGLSIVVGGIIGSGIFVAPSIIARIVRAPGLSLVVWLVAGLLAVCGALCYAELTAAIPVTGGTYAYLRRAFGSPLIAFCFGWTFFFVDGPGSIAAVGTVFAAYATLLMPSGMAVSPNVAKIMAVGSIVVLTAVNYVGVRIGGTVQTILTGLKIVTLVTVVVIAFVAVPAAGPRFAPFLPEASNTVTLVVSIGAAMMPALFAFGGWTYSTYVAGEMIDPQRNVPRSLIFGIGVVLAIYLAVNATYLWVLPFDRVRESSHVASDAMQAAIGPRGASLVAAAVVVSTLGALNAIILSYARIAYAMARDGLFFERLQRVHPRFRTPANAIVVQGVIASAFAFAGGFEEILGYFSFVEYLFFSLGVAAVIVLRVRAPNLPRPHRVWAYPLPPVLFLSVSAVYLTSLLATRFRGSMVGVVLLLTGLPFYFWWRRRAGAYRPQPVA